MLGAFGSGGALAISGVAGQGGVWLGGFDGCAAGCDDFEAGGGLVGVGRGSFADAAGDGGAFESRWGAMAAMSVTIAAVSWSSAWRSRVVV